MKKLKVLVLAVVILMVSSSFAFAQYPNIITGFVYSEGLDNAKLTAANIYIQLKALDPLVKKNKDSSYSITLSGNKITITKTGQIIKTKK